MPARETIDIEALLFRAYGEKKIHRLPFKTAAAGALGLIMPRAGVGGFSASEKVDTSSFSARVAGELREVQARMGAAPSGLIDLHDVVLGLENFYVEALHGFDFQVWDADTAERLGHRIFDTADGASIAKVKPRTGGKPGEVVEIEPRRRLTRIVTSALMIQCGQYGDRPHVPDVVVLRERPVYRGARKEAVGYEPEYETPPHAVVEGRASYAVWYTALGILREVFARSTEYDITGPTAPEAPWAGPGPRVLKGRRRSALRDGADAHVGAYRALNSDAHVIAFRALRKVRKTKKNRVAAAA